MHAAPKSKVRRCLFGKPESGTPSVAGWLEEKLKTDRERMSQKYGFNFDAELPLSGSNYEWTSMDVENVPEFYWKEKKKPIRPKPVKPFVEQTPRKPRRSRPSPRSKIGELGVCKTPGDLQQKQNFVETTWTMSRAIENMSRAHDVDTATGTSPLSFKIHKDKDSDYSPTNNTVLPFPDSQSSSLSSSPSSMSSDSDSSATVRLKQMEITDFMKNVKRKRSEAHTMPSSMSSSSSSQTQSQKSTKYS